MTSLEDFNSASSRLFIGAMSGTSADGVDAALVEISGSGLDMRMRLLGQNVWSYSTSLRREIIKIRQSGTVDLSALARLGTEISRCYAQTIIALIERERLEPGDIAAVAVHGQTLYHAPPMTIQWIDPALIAWQTGLRVISDFRRADCAAGGQGAPLVPFADFLLSRNCGKSRLLLNLGGVANITYVRAGGSLHELIAFDTGPGNCLCDAIMRKTGEPFDAGGVLALSGNVVEGLSEEFVRDSYFHKLPPKSTDGPELIALFNACLGEREASVADQLRTACDIAARCIFESVKRFVPGKIDEVVASGGGVHNAAMMRALRERFSPIPLLSSDSIGVPTQAKEAMAFALLGAATLDNYPANVPSVTGASRSVVLGCMTPAP